MRTVPLFLSALALAALCWAFLATPALAEGESSPSVVLTEEQLREALYAAEVEPTLLLPRESQEEAEEPPKPPQAIELAELEALEIVEEKFPFDGAGPALRGGAHPDAPKSAWAQAMGKALDDINAKAARLPARLKLPLITENDGDLVKQVRTLRGFVYALDTSTLSDEEHDAVVELEGAINQVFKFTGIKLNTAGGATFAVPHFAPNWANEPASAALDAQVASGNPTPVVVAAEDGARDGDFAQVAQEVAGGPPANAPVSALVADAPAPLAAEVAGLAPQPSAGVYAPLSAVDAERGQAIAAMSGSGQAANGTIRSVAGGASASTGEQDLAADRAAVAAQAEKVTFSDNAEILGGSKNEKAARAAFAADRSVEQVENLSTDALLNVGSTALDPLLLATLATQAPGIITTLVDLISGAPSTEELILEQLKAIERQIEELTTQVKAGFEVVDANLQTIDVTLNRDSKLLEDANEHIDELSNEMAQVEDRLDQIEADIYRIAATQREEALQVALNSDLGYSARTGGKELPLDQFEQATSLFFTWGAEDPFNAISELPAEDWSVEPDEIAAQLGSSAASNALDFNLDYLSSHVNEEGWGPPGQPLVAGLPNPEVWSAGASALAQLLTENPQYVTEFQLKELAELKNVGLSLRSALGKLTVAEAAPEEPGLEFDGVKLKTGSSVLNHALLNYLKAGVSPTVSLLDRVEAEEHDFLARQDPGAAPGADPENCVNCALGTKPVAHTADEGKALINLWGGAEQKPVEQGLTKFASESQKTQKGEGGRQGEMNVCNKEQQQPAAPGLDEQDAEPLPIGLPASNLVESPLLDPVPNVYANAWHLGLGHLDLCYATAYFGEPSGSYKNLVIEFDAYWVAGNTSYRVMRFGLSVGHAIAQAGEDPNQEFQVLWEHATNPRLEPGAIFSNLIEQAVYTLRTLKGPQDLKAAFFGEPNCDHVLKIPASVPEPEEITRMTGIEGEPYSISCYADTSAPQEVGPSAGAGGLTAEVERELAKLRSETYKEMAPPENRDELNEGGEKLEAAVKSLDGARSLMNDYTELGLPESMANDPQLRALILGSGRAGVESEQELEETQAGELRPHLLDNSAPDHEIYEFFHNAQLNTEIVQEASEKPSLAWKPETAYSEGQVVESESKVYLALKDITAEADAKPPKAEVWELLEPPASDPAAPGGILEENIVKRAAVLAKQLQSDLAATTAEGEGPQEDPLIGGTIARLEVTEAILHAAPVDVAAPEVIGTPEVGKTLSCSEGQWKGSPPPTLSYQWLRDGSVVASGQTYLVSTADVGHALSCLVTATSEEGEEATAESASVTVAVQPAFTLVDAQEIQGSGAGFTQNELIAELGQTVDYKITVQNTGNVPLKLADFADASCEDIAGGPGESELAPGESTSYTCQRLIEHKGIYTNEASVEGIPPTGDGFPLTRTSNTLIALGPNPAPGVETKTASEIAVRAATLTATVNPRGVEVIACKFEYGTTSLKQSAACSKLPGAGTSAVAVSAPVKGLAPSTTYRYRISARSLGGTSAGAETTFKTLAAAAPAVETGTAAEVLQRGATLDATVNPNGEAITACKFEYGTTSLSQSAACSKLPGPGTSPVAVSTQLKLLEPATTYHYRISATSLGGTTRGAQMTLKTIAAFAPTAETHSATEVGPSTAVLNATVNPNGGEVTSCRFEYGTTTAYGLSAACSKSPGTGTSAVAVSATLKGLSAGVTYHFRISATSASGTEKGHDASFKT